MKSDFVVKAYLPLHRGPMMGWALLFEGARLHVHVCVGDYVHERRLADVGVAWHKTALCKALGALLHFLSLSGSRSWWRD